MISASAAVRAARPSIVETLAALEAIPPATLSRDAQIDRAMLLNRFQFERWTDDSAKSWEWDPLPYNDAAGNSLYTLIARDFAPLPERLNNAAARMEKLPGLLAQTRAELVAARVPDVHAQTYAQQHAGLMEIVDGLILPNADDLGPTDRTRLARRRRTPACGSRDAPSLDR